MWWLVIPLFWRAKNGGGESQRAVWLISVFAFWCAVFLLAANGWLHLGLCGLCKCETRPHLTTSIIIAGKSTVSIALNAHSDKQKCCVLSSDVLWVHVMHVISLSDGIWLAKEFPILVSDGYRWYWYFELSAQLGWANANDHSICTCRSKMHVHCAA
jgi:hypothetical protein